MSSGIAEPNLGWGAPLTLSNGDSYLGKTSRDYKKHGEGLVLFMSSNSDCIAYCGQFLDGESAGYQMHGLGTMFLVIEKSKYIGCFADNQRCGPGKIVAPNGSVFEGTFHDDMKHGPGVLKRSNGDVIQGEWSFGDCSSTVNVKYANGDTYSGGYSEKTGERGQGRLVCTNGDTYTGQWLSGLKHGKGVMTSHREEEEGEYVRDGQWAAGKLNGHASVRYPSGEMYTGFGVMRYAASSERYEGMWREGFHSGEGVLSCVESNGNLVKIYEGEWLASNFHGTGTHYNVSHNSSKRSASITPWNRTASRFHNRQYLSYTGQWQHGARSGTGRCSYKDGAVYDGEWKEDLRVDKGSYRFADDTVYTGGWVQDKMGVSQNPVLGRLQFPDGSVYEGKFQDNSRHGHGTLTSRNGSVYSGQWLNGSQHGQGQFTSGIDESVYIGSWVANKREGHGVETYPLSKESYSGQWRQNEYHTTELKAWQRGVPYDKTKHGCGVYRYANGDVYEGQWVRGKRQGSGVLTSGRGEELCNGDWALDRFLSSVSVAVDPSVVYDRS
eukprot:gene31679-39129_t